jgi:hypothetical protein
VKQQELAQLTAHMAKLHVAQPHGHRERFKDALIEVLRADCDDERWQAVVTRARELQAKQGVQHG